MDYATVAASATAIAGTLCGLGGIWLRGRIHRHRLREEARRDHVRKLPPGSRLLDLGRHGMIIDVGSTDCGPRPADER
ncbi:hypothetical protein [Nonomuraea sp. NPDC049141]|uniref:hypothetical protein n=1 Tax=Nonomuraea sp. NPDC049141 TaxID=3155500 RepID=UPI0033D89440